MCYAASNPYPKIMYGISESWQIYLATLRDSCSMWSNVRLMKRGKFLEQAADVSRIYSHVLRYSL